MTMRTFNYKDVACAAGLLEHLVINDIKYKCVNWPYPHHAKLFQQWKYKKEYNANRLLLLINYFMPNVKLQLSDLKTICGWTIIPHAETIINDILEPHALESAWLCKAFIEYCQTIYQNTCLEVPLQIASNILINYFHLDKPPYAI